MWRSRSSTFVSFLTLIALCAGCGGGSGGGTTGSANANGQGRGCSDATYIPNYVATFGFGALRHWNRFPLAIFFKHSPQWSQNRQDQAWDGLRRWVDLTHGNVQLELTNVESSAKVTIEFVMQSSLGGRVVGVCASSYLQNVLQFATIQLAVDYEGAVRGPWANTVTAMHEMGHALGIGGHSLSTLDIMYPCAECSGGDLSSRDLNTLETAYCGSYGRIREESADSKTPTTTETFACPAPR